MPEAEGRAEGCEVGLVESVGPIDGWEDGAADTLGA